MKLFGRITAPTNQCLEIIKTFMNPITTLVVYETGTKNEGEHCHFIAVTEKEYKTERSCRDSFSRLCHKITKEKKNYSIKEFDDTKLDECLRYMLKDVEGHGHFCKESCSLQCPANVVLNGLCIARDKLVAYHAAYWKNRKELKDKKERGPCWKKIYDYITEKDGTLFDKCNINTPRKIANHVYDYFEENEKFLQNDRFIELMIKTIMIQAYKTTTLRSSLKKSMVSNWIQNFSTLCYYDYQEEQPIDSEDEL